MYIQIKSKRRKTNLVLYEDLKIPASTKKHIENTYMSMISKDGLQQYLQSNLVWSLLNLENQAVLNNE